MPDEYYNHELFKKNNTLYTFKIISALNIGKIKIVSYKRDQENHRIDMAEFYLNYKEFVAILKAIELAFLHKKEYNKELTGGEDGARKMYINLKFSSGVSLGFKMFDNIISTKSEKTKDYSGKVGFILKSLEDIIEFIDIKKTINNWELANINKILNNGFNKKAE